MIPRQRSGSNSASGDPHGTFYAEGEEAISPITGAKVPGGWDETLLLFSPSLSSYCLASDESADVGSVKQSRINKEQAFWPREHFCSLGT